MPATRCTHHSQRQAADELQWRSFGAWPTVWPSLEGLPTTSSRGQADNGMLCRTGPEFQNREQVGAEPPAESAGPAGPASALPKRPSKGRIPLDGTIGAPSGTPIPHTLPLRKNKAAKPGKNFAKRVIFTPQTRFRRLSGEICSKRVPRLLLSARFEYVSQSSWHRPANSAYVWAKSRPIGAETPFEKQKCTRMSKSEGMWRSSAPSNAGMPCHCGENEPIMCPHIIGNGWLRACAGALWPQGNEGAKPSLYQ